MNVSMPIGDAAVHIVGPVPFNGENRSRKRLSEKVILKIFHHILRIGHPVKLTKLLSEAIRPYFFALDLRPSDLKNLTQGFYLSTQKWIPGQATSPASTK
jgi:hypothetical protein